MNFKLMSKQRKFVLITAAVGVLSMFLPWIQVSVFGYSQSVNGLHGSGILVFLCFAAAGVMACLGDQTKTLDKTMWMITLICGALATLIIIWDIIGASASIYGSFLGFGIYVAVLAAIGVLLSAFLFRSSTDSIKDSFESLKHGISNTMKNTSPVNSTTSPDNVNRSTIEADKNNPNNITSQGYVKDPDNINNPGNPATPL